MHRIHAPVYPNVVEHLLRDAPIPQLNTDYTCIVNKDPLVRPHKPVPHSSVHSGYHKRLLPSQIVRLNLNDDFIVVIPPITSNTKSIVKEGIDDIWGR